MHLWARLVSLGLSLAALTVAFWPRPGDSRHAPLKVLLRWPVFWLGLIFFGYITLQTNNPAWTFVRNEQGAWWMQAIDHASWLPSGVTGMPGKMYSPLVAALPFVSAFICVCAVWSGLTRRRSVKSLLALIALNGVLLALFSVIQSLMGNGKLYWVIPPINAFVGPFLMRNHGGAYYNLIAGLTFALAAYQALRTERRLLKSGPGPLYVLGGLLLFAAVVCSLSRMAITSAILFGLITLLALGIRHMAGRRSHFPPLVTYALTGLLAFFSVFAVFNMDTKAVWKRFQQLDGGTSSPQFIARQQATHATLDMAADRPWTGHGFGSFRFLFQTYQLKHNVMGIRGGSVRAWWQHAHNDYAEALAELGWLGLSPLIGMLVWYLRHCVRRRLWRNRSLCIALGGIAMIAVHARFDFPIHLPAIAVTLPVLLILYAKWEP